MQGWGTERERFTDARVQRNTEPSLELTPIPTPEAASKSPGGDHGRVLLDECLPRWHFSESHSRLVAAPPERVWDALIALRSSDVRLMQMLMSARTLPAVVTRRRYSLASAANARSLLDAFLAGGFLVLARDADEIVIGGIGRFWRPRGGGLVRLPDPQQFIHFAQPGFAKAAVNFRTLSDPSGTLLTTQTRILTTDERARRMFGRYWRIIRPGSGLIRRDILAAAAARAEHAA